MLASILFVICVSFIPWHAQEPHVWHCISIEPSPGIYASMSANAPFSHSQLWWWLNHLKVFLLAIFRFHSHFNSLIVWRRRIHEHALALDSLRPHFSFTIRRKKKYCICLDWWLLRRNEIPLKMCIKAGELKTKPNEHLVNERPQRNLYVRRIRFHYYYYYYLCVRSLFFYLRFLFAFCSLASRK